MAWSELHFLMHFVMENYDHVTLIGKHVRGCGGLLMRFRRLINVFQFQRVLNFSYRLLNILVR